MKAGKGDALHQEKGLFCILFVAAWTKRMTSGGTRPTGYCFGFYKDIRQTDQRSVALFVWLCNLKLKAKLSGLPDSNVIFFVATKRGLSIKQEAKESSTLRWACFTQFILVANIIGINLW